MQKKKKWKELEGISQSHVTGKDTEAYRNKAASWKPH